MPSAVSPLPDLPSAPAPAPGPGKATGHDHAGHHHAGHHHAGPVGDHHHDHGHGPAGHDRPAAIGPSLLLLSLTMRLAVAAALLVPLWLAVLLVVGVP